MADSILKLSNEIVEPFISGQTMIESWIAPLLYSSFDEEPELRNRVFVIFVSGICDIARDYIGRTAALDKRAGKLGEPGRLRSINWIRQYCAGAMDVISIFDRDELLVIREMRDQYVHGKLDHIHKENRTVYWVNCQTVEREKLSSSEYWQIWNRLTSDGTGIDEFLEGQRKRFVERRCLFWLISFKMLLGSEAFRLIVEDLRSDGRSPPRVNIQLSDDSYWKTADIREREGPPLPSLRDVRDRLEPDRPARRDPVFPDDPGVTRP